LEPVQLAAVLAATIVLASMVSVELGLSVALIELAFGVVVGNVFSLDPGQDWLVFVTDFASIVLTLLAGAEIDPDDFRERAERRHHRPRSVLTARDGRRALRNRAYGYRAALVLARR